MRKRASVLLVPLFLLVCSQAAVAAEEAGGVQPATMEKYQKARERVEALPGTPAAKYAPEAIEAASKSIAAAQEGLKAGSDKATRESVEMAILQVTLAGALAEERAAAGKSAGAKAELDRLEQRLAAILAGKGDK
ncbi:MAG: DUF4398 domain-containing protein [Deltaproteobacteria bacterium]|nr:DUF4398 domain-containing protein [Deltaproteobacteria bacterium]